MSKYNSNGEVYGSKALTFATIAISAFVLAGIIYSPAQQQQGATPTQQTLEQVVVTGHPTPVSKVAG